MIKSLWASVQGNPVFMRQLNGWLTIALSLWALVSGHLSAWQAARVEVRQEQAEQGTNPDAVG